MLNRTPIILTLFCAVILFSCKKTVDDKKKQVLLDTITSGEWHIEEFLEGSVDKTADFTGYSFQFNRDGTVLGHKDTIQDHGTWTGDIANYSITSDFPSAADPVKKLNGTWKVIDSTSDTVQAEMTGPQGKNILHLRKNP